MNKLSIISKLVTSIKVLVIAGGLFVIAFFSLMLPGDQMVAIGNPVWEVTDETSEEMIRSTLPLSDPLKIEKLYVDAKIPVTTGFRFAIICLMLAFTTYLLTGLWIIEKILHEVRAQRPFTVANATRIRFLGVLIALVPVLSGLASSLFTYWLRTTYDFGSLRSHEEDGAGLVFFLIGLLIYVLGVAFAQGVKLQEESELTI